MCGILGQVADRQEALDQWSAEEAIRVLRHRGPDGEGVFEDRSAAPVCRIVHTRLAIIDTSDAGQQPMFSPDKRYVLAFNGEIYNYLELRRELELRGETFKTQSDSEVLLRSFVVWGPACLQRLRGMFAFGVWDRKERSLFLARDRLGIKPLYFCIQGSSIAFASEVRALLATGLSKGRISRPALAAFVTYGSIWGEQSLIEGIEELPAGSYRVFHSTKPSQGSYWSLPLETGSGAPRSVQEALELVEPLLRESVRLQLRSDVRLGVFLSAGIDSASLAALAKLELGHPPTTLTVAFEGELNEGVLASATARHLGTDHHEIFVSQDAAVRWVPEAVSSMDQPSVDGVNTWIVSRATRQAGIRVALSGLGGDEVFAGYGSFRWFSSVLRLARGFRVLGTFASDLASKSPFGPWPNRWRKAAWIARQGGDPGATYDLLRAVFTPECSHALLPGGTSPPQIARDAGDVMDPVNFLSRMELTKYLRFTLLRDTDVMSMAHGLEVRPPLLDELLVTRLLTLPGRMKIAGRANKPLLLGCTRALLPKGIARRPKTGFDLPFDRWLDGPLSEWHAAGMSGLAQLGFEGAACRALASARSRRVARLQWHRWLALATLGHWATKNRCSL